MYDLSILIAVCSNDNVSHFKSALNSIYAESEVVKQVVLVADGPLSEEHDEVIRRYEELDRNFTCVRLVKNQGLAAALNAGLACCESELVARMDSDDVCDKNRFSRQLKFMTSNPHFSVSSGKVTEYCSGLLDIIAEKRLPTEHSKILAYSKFRNPINHMACIFRKSDVLAIGGYPEQFRKAQDFALWCAMLKAGYRFANLDENLVNVRAGAGLFDRRGIQYFYGEMEVLSFLKRIGHINHIEFAINIFVRLSARLAPTRIKKTVYRILRDRI
tara:strand:- start:7903 stop:8721 length:819 start_codon:yes stop_codon:yes gene_type:complete